MVNNQNLNYANSPKRRGKKIFFGIVILIIIIFIIVFGIKYFVKEEVTEELTREEALEGCLAELEERGHDRAGIGAVFKKDVSICNFELVENQLNCRDEYYFYTTLIENNNYCGNIKDEPFKKICLMIYDSENRCNELQKEENIVCEAAFGGSKEGCATIEDIDVRGFCESIDYQIKALKEKDINACNKIENEEWKRICLTLSGKGLSEEEKSVHCLKEIEKIYGY